MINLIAMPSGMEWMILSMFWVIIIPLIFYLITLQNTLRLISPENRMMPPGNVWLLLIPVFNLVWQFIVLNNLINSIDKEFTKRDLPKSDLRSTYNLGLAMCILNFTLFIPFIGMICGFGALICWIIYWIKIGGYKNSLTN